MTVAMLFWLELMSPDVITHACFVAIDVEKTCMLHVAHISLLVARIIL